MDRQQQYGAESVGALGIQHIFVGPGILRWIKWSQWMPLSEQILFPNVSENHVLILFIVSCYVADLHQLITLYSGRSLAGCRFLQGGSPHKTPVIAWDIGVLILKYSVKFTIYKHGNSLY